MVALEDVTLHRVSNFDDACEFMRWLGERHPGDIVGVDTETGGLDFWRQPLRMVQFGDMAAGWAIPWDQWSGLVHSALDRYDGRTVMHNAKFDTTFLEVNGCAVDWRKVDDTRILAHLVDPVGRVGLKPLSERYVHPKASIGQHRLSEGMSAMKWTWATVPTDFEPYWAYGALDAVLTSHVWNALSPHLMKFGGVYEMELAAQQVVMRMERRGCRIDLRYTFETGDRLETYVTDAKAWVQENYGVSATSTTQVAKKLVADGVELYKLTEKGAYSLDKEVLAGLTHPLAEIVLKIRQAEKIAHTYFRNFTDMHDNGFLHPSVNVLGARTGRMSVQTPALQTLPRGRIVRDCFIPRDDRVLVLADFDQIEYRLLAHFARETTMLDAIRSGRDLHTYTAQLVYGLGDVQPTREQRQIAKNAGFAKLYGAGVEKFAKTARVPFEVGRDFLERYDITYPGVRRFQKEVEAIANRRLSEEGEAYVMSPFGRRHPADSDAHYKLVNYLIQGTAADVLKFKLLELDLAGLGDLMVLPVHDEIVFDVPTEDVPDVMHTVKTVMEEHKMFAVPLTVSVDRVLRWGEKYADET